MTSAEAIELVGPAVAAAPGATWADFGAGTGVFTRALASLLGREAKVIAVDQDARALRTLSRSISREPGTAAEIITSVGDFRDMDSIPALESVELDGALFANSLHFAPDPDRVLKQTVRRLTASGRIVVVEYEGRRANRWVPYPVSLERLRALASGALLDPPRVVGERASAFGGTLYCALLGRSRLAQ